MFILAVTNDDTLNANEIRDWFKGLYEKASDIITANSLDDAKKVIETSIIAGQKHLDFVITDWSFGEKNAKWLLSWIRESNEIYSSKNFKISGLPVLLIEDTKFNVNALNEGFDGLAIDFPADLTKFRFLLNGVIKSWRSKVADDLANLGLDPAKKVPGNLVIAPYYSSRTLKILSAEFAQNSTRKFNYLWQGVLLPGLIDATEKFEAMILSKSPSAEKDIHSFLIRNPSFLLGENFVSNIYEKHFYLNGSQKYVEPDFLNIPHDYSQSDPEVFEIKLPSQELVRPHQNRFVTKARKSFEQVEKYKSLSRHWRGGLLSVVACATASHSVTRV